MATKKATTKSKSKKSTTKKATTKTNKKSSGKNTPKFSVSADVKKSNSTKKIKNKSLTTILKLSVVAYIWLLAAVWTWMNPTYFDIFLPYKTADPLASNALAPAIRVLFAVDLRWVISALLAVSILFPVMYMTVLKKFYIRQIEAKKLWTRWLDAAIAGLFMLEAIALLSGWQSVIEMKLIGLAAIMIAGLACLQETRIDAVGRWSKNIDRAIILTKLFLIALIGSSAVATYIYGEVVDVWYVYTLYGGAIISFVWVHRLFRKLPKLTGEKFELHWQIKQLVIRTGFVAILLSGFMK